jgi:hypothetical protein
MSFSSFSGPLRSGTVKEGAGRNTGLAVLTQSYDSGNLTGTTTGNYDVAAMVLPAGSQIISIFVDQVVAATVGTTTISTGTTSGGAQLMAAVATTAGGRFQGTATAATQLAWQTSTSADTTVFVRNVVGTGTLGAGRFIVTVNYAQRVVDGTNAIANPVSA